MTARTKGRQKHQFLLLQCLDQRNETERERERERKREFVWRSIEGRIRGRCSHFRAPKEASSSKWEFHQRNELADFFLIVARTIDQISRPWSLNTESYLCSISFNQRIVDSRDFVPRYPSDFISSHSRGSYFSTRFDQFL